MENFWKRKKSKTWNYFTPQNETKAICNFCDASLSYKTSISNLKKHIDKKHTLIEVVEISSEHQKSPLTSNNEDEEASRYLLASQASDPFYIQSSPSLPDGSSELSATWIPQEPQVTRSSVPKRQKMQTTLAIPKVKSSISGHFWKRKKSIVWKYFTPQDDTKATCNFCNASLAYQSTTGNLKKHIARKHASVKIASELCSENQEIPRISNNGSPSTSNRSPQVSPLNIQSISSLPCTSTSLISQESKVTQNSVLNKKQNMQTTLAIPKANTSISKQKRKKSIVWNYFTPQNETKASCNFCNASLAYQSTTGNLRKHIARKHASLKIASDLCSKNQETPLISNLESPSTSISAPQASPTNIQFISSLSCTSNSSNFQEPQVNQSSVSKKTDHFVKKTLDNKLLQLIIKDFQPLSIVDNIGFQEFTRALNPSYILPSRKVLSALLLADKYEEVKIHAKESIKSAKSITITTECWTSFNNESFLAVTAHFINDEFQTESIILEVDSSVFKHTSTNLAKELRRITMAWGLQNKILLCISDNAANIKKAISEELQWEHLGCLAHTINLIVQDALEPVQPLINKVSDIVSHCRQSALTKTKLDFYKKQNGKDSNKLIQSVCTRLNSVYYMLQRMTIIKTSLADTRKEDWPVLSNQEFDIIDELIKILDPIESTTKIMASEKQVTLSLVIIITNGLQDLYKQFMENNSISAQSRSVLEKIANGIATWLKNIETNSTLLVTTFLDPRFKHIGFSTDSSAEKAKALVTNALIEVLEEKDENRTSRLHRPDSDSSNDQASVSTIWSSFDKKASSFIPPDCSKKAIMEIQRYIDQPLLERTENPINWWKINTHHFPNLSQLVRLKFGIVATSDVPCERIFSFSKPGQLLIERRNRLSVNKVKQIIFIQQNSK